MHPQHIRQFVNDVYLSADPEFFIFDEDGNVVPSDEILPKQIDAHNVKNSRYSRYRANIYTDGVQAEFNLNKFTCRHHVVKCLIAARQGISKYVPNDMKAVFTPSVEMAPENVAFLSDFARQLGCDPSRGAWIGGEDMDNPAGEESPTRYAGGHIHMGAKKTRMEEGLNTNVIKNHEFARKVVKACDYVLALPFVQLFGGKEAARRREAYGKAGTYRVKSYGLEYRVLGPRWARYTQLVGPVFGYFREALSIVYAGELERLLSIVASKDVIDAINEADREKAAKLYNEIKPFLMNRKGERHTGGQYLRAFDICCALGMENIGCAWENNHSRVNSSPSWGNWCAGHLLEKHSDLMEAHEHGNIYLEPDDFKTTVAAS